jgi:hypothetical protein
MTTIQLGATRYQKSYFSSFFLCNKVSTEYSTVSKKYHELFYFIIFVYVTDTISKKYRCIKVSDMYHDADMIFGEVLV